MKVLGEINRASEPRRCPPGAGNCYDANGSDYRVFTTTNGVFLSYRFSSPRILCCESVFTPSSCLSWSVTACCALILLINPIHLIGDSCV